MRKNIIRVEHSSGFGLFRANDKNNNAHIQKHSKFDDIYDRHMDFSKFPPFHSDKELSNKLSSRECQNYRFGFLSLEQLENSLTREELKECIEKLDFRVYMIDATDFYESKYQVIFRPESVKNRKDISSMFI